MAYQIVPKPHMNRIYVTGDVEPIRYFLIDLRARQEDGGYWLPLHQASALREKMKTAEEYSSIARSLRASFSADTHVGYAAPAGVTMDDLWSDQRIAGSENWYAGSDGVIYRMISDYATGPMWWRTSATREQVERAKALGMRVI